jgi:hypothetical protein
MPKKPPKQSSGQEVDVPRLLSDLANMLDSGASHFRKGWKKLYQDYADAKLLKLRDELRLLWSEHIPVELKEDDTLANPVPDLSDQAEDLREEWQWRQSGSQVGWEPLQQYVCEQWLKAAGTAGLLVDWEQQRLRPDPKCLPLVLVWGCLKARDRFAYCANPECPAPFFIAKRSDQKYCSEMCATPAKREAKLRWWRANRAGGAD